MSRLKNNSGFPNWLNTQENRDDITGKLAKFVSITPNWPVHALRITTFKRALREANAPTEVIDGFDSVFREYIASR